MPVFEKRRFQHGALDGEAFRRHLGQSEAQYRQVFQSLWS
jgi:hypothetical protein